VPLLCAASILECINAGQRAKALAFRFFMVQTRAQYSSGIHRSRIRAHLFLSCAHWSPGNRPAGKGLGVVTCSLFQIQVTPERAA
jgi:hypothetical protein